MGSFIPYEPRLSKFITEYDSTCQLFLYWGSGRLWGNKEHFLLLSKIPPIEIQKIRGSFKASEETGIHIFSVA